MMIGIDLVKISRIEKFYERFGDKALKRFLDSSEIKLAKSANTIAGFWATKEAVAKALGLGIGLKCSFQDIKIHKDANNAPYFTLSKNLIEELNITDTSLSITHEDEYAIAVVAIESSCNKNKILYHN